MKLVFCKASEIFPDLIFGSAWFSPALRFPHSTKLGFLSGERVRETMADSSSPKKEEATGWGGWGFSSAFSVLSDLQKAATVAAEEITNKTSVVAKNTAKGISDLQIASEPDSGSGEEELEAIDANDAPEGEAEKLKKSALDRLEKASEDSFFSQGLKVFDNSVENITSGAWQALGTAWKGGSNLVQKLETSAATLADSIQHGNLPANAASLAPSLIETGKAFTAKGIQVLEFVGKETMDLLIDETGIEVEKDPKESEHQNEDDQFSEEASFDRCFYIYGGPEQLEELEALSNHHTLLYNRKKAKLPSEKKVLYDGNLKKVKQIFTLNTDNEFISTDTHKGKTVETIEVDDGIEMKTLCDSSVSKAAEMAAGFAAALEGLAVNEIIQRTSGRLEAIHSEGVHRLSELCCFAVSQLLMFGKSIISSVSKSQSDEHEVDANVKIDWPEDSILKARIIRSKAGSMTAHVEAVSNSFITGISDVLEASVAAIKKASADNANMSREKSIQDKAHDISDHLRSDGATAVDKIQDGLQYLAFVVISTSVPTV